MIFAPSKENYITYAAMAALLLIPPTRRAIHETCQHLRSFVDKASGYDLGEDGSFAAVVIAMGLAILFLTIAVFRAYDKKKLPLK